VIGMIQDRYRRGDLVRDIARDIGCHPRDVRSVAKVLGLPSRNIGFCRHLNEPKIIEDYLSGIKVRDISQRHDCGQRTVMRIARQNNLPKRHERNGR